MPTRPGARQIYQAYNDLEFRNPQYAKPDFERLKAGSASDLVQYESFVSYFLYACEEAVGAFHSQARVAGDLRLRPERPPAVLVRKGGRRAGLSDDL